MRPTPHNAYLIVALLASSISCGGDEFSQSVPHDTQNLINYVILPEADDVRSLLGSRDLVDNTAPTPPITLKFPPPPATQPVVNGSFRLAPHFIDGQEQRWDVVDFQITTSSLRLTASSGTFVVMQKDIGRPLKTSLSAVINGRSVQLSGEGGPETFSGDSPPKFRQVAMTGDGAFVFISADPVTSGTQE